MAKKTMEILHPEGLTDILRTLEASVGEDTLRQAAVAGARVIQKEMKLRAPVGKYTHKRSGKTYPPGTLRDNILIYHDDDYSAGNSLQTYGVWIGKDAFYASIIEYGTSDRAAHPFIRPAFEATKKAVRDEVIRVVNKKIQEQINGK